MESIRKESGGRRKEEKSILKLKSMSPEYFHFKLCYFLNYNM